MEHVKRIVRLEQKNKYEGNCYMYFDIVRIGEKVMESCWYPLCVYKNKRKKKEEKRHRSKFTLWKEKKWKVEKKNEKPKKYIM